MHRGACLRRFVLDHSRWRGKLGGAGARVLRLPSHGAMTSMSLRISRLGAHAAFSFHAPSARTASVRSLEGRGLRRFIGPCSPWEPHLPETAGRDVSQGALRILRGRLARDIVVEEAEVPNLTGLAKGGDRVFHPAEELRRGSSAASTHPEGNAVTPLPYARRRHPFEGVNQFECAAQLGRKWRWERHGSKPGLALP